MPNNLAVQSDPWQAAKAAVGSGVTQRRAAQKLGLDYETLRKRAQREAWPRPHLAVRKAKQAHQAIVETAKQESLSQSVPMSQNGQKVSMDGSLGTLTPQEKTGTIILESAQELAESGSMIGLKLLHGQLKDAQANHHDLAPIVDAKGIVTAIRGVRMAAGLDKTQVNVGLNLWNDAPMTRAVVGTSQSVPDVETWTDEE